MKEIVFASFNLKKAEEIQRIAKDKVKVICLNDIKEARDIEQAEETGKTFAENAKIKAKFWAEKLNMPVIAEDSGISIDALDGYPGVFTKRCIEKLCPGASVDVDNPDELYPVLLNLMKKSGNESTKAYWFSAIAFAFGEKEIVVQESICGDMCEKKGEREFGFDQYFIPEGKNKTLSELGPEEKDKIGPRRKAFKEILEQI